MWHFFQGIYGVPTPSDIDYIDEAEDLPMSEMIEKICTKYNHGASTNTKALEVILSNEPAFNFRGICSYCGYSHNNENDKLKTDLIYEQIDAVIFAGLFSRHISTYSYDSHNSIISKIDIELEHILEQEVFSSKEFKGYYFNNKDITDLENLLSSKLADLPETTFTGVCPKCKNSHNHTYDDIIITVQDEKDLYKRYDLEAGEIFEH
jgi:hypothetical protein